MPVAVVQNQGLQIFFEDSGAGPPVEEDRSLPPPLSRRIHDRLRHSTFDLIPAAGHLSSLERPALVTDAILGFLAHAN